MAASTINLTQLASETTQALCKLWDDIGVEEDERSQYVVALSDRVAELYRSAVAEQRTRLEDLHVEIQTLQRTIENMECAMDQHDGVPANNGLSLIQYRDTLENTRIKLQNLWDTREAELKEKETMAFQLYADLQDDVQPNFSCIGDRMTANRVSEYEGEIERLQSLKLNRRQQIDRICDEIADMWNEMELSAQEDDSFDAFIVDNRDRLGWSAAVIDKLQEKCDALQAEKAIREEKITIMGKQITALWKRLMTPEEEQTAFLEDHAGLGEATIAAVETYLVEKTQEFQARLVDLIGDARKQIEQMWNTMRAGSAQRMEMFPPYYSDGPFSDELYQVHEAYIQQLEAALEDLKPILKSIEKREELKADKSEYESIIADPSRLLGRSNSVARLKEEKLERRVKRELPALTKRLREQIKEWEARSKRDFTVDDERYLDVLDAEELADQKAKDDAKAARDAAKGSSSTAAVPEPARAAPRSTSVGRASVFKAGASSGPAQPAVVKKLSATLPRKTSTSGMDASESSVPAPPVPLKENSKPASAAVSAKEVLVSDAAKVSAAKILAQL